MSSSTSGTKKLPIEDLLKLFTGYFSLRGVITTNLISPVTQEEEGQPIGTWFRSAGAAESMRDSLVGPRTLFRRQPPEGPRLAALLYTFRDRRAKEPKDKIYSLLGIAKKEYEIEINPDESDGGLTKCSLYTVTTRKLLSRVLYVLLWVESPKKGSQAGPTVSGCCLRFPIFTQGQ